MGLGVGVVRYLAKSESIESHPCSGTNFTIPHTGTECIQLRGSFHSDKKMLLSEKSYGEGHLGGSVGLVS